MNKIVLILCFSVFFQFGALAQFTLSGELRNRAELRRGYRTMPLEDSQPAGFMNQRSRLNLNHKNDRVTTHFSFHDLRVWGQEAQKQHIPSLSLHQAWVELFLSDSFSVKAGRQELRYDNQRFFAINNWILPGQKHDLILFKYKTQIGTFHLGTAFNQDGEDIHRNFSNFGNVYTLNNYKYMNYLWYHTPFAKAGKLSFLSILDGFENESNLHIRGTHSLFSTYTFDGFTLMFNPALQNGTNPSGQNIMAWYLSTEAQIQASTRYRLTAGFELFSGNDFTETEDDTYRAFDVMHGAGHANNGFLDYFTNIPAHTKGAGLVNPFLKNRFQVSTNTHLDLHLHAFTLANNYVHEEKVIDKYLGTELDFILGYRFNSFTQLEVGYAMMFGTESMEIIKGGSKDVFAHWAYAMLTVKPVFWKE